MGYGEKHLVLALQYIAKEKKIGPEDYTWVKIKESKKRSGSSFCFNFLKTIT